MQKVLETTIIKHEKKMEIKTHKEMLVKYIGEVGTPERDAFDAQVRAGVEEYRIGEAIKQTRKKIGFTQQQLGELLGYGATTIANYESGYRLPDLETFFEIALHYRAPLEDIMREPEE